MPMVRRSDAIAVPGVERADPRRLLDRQPAARITVVTAPAGSGKSRLVQDWLDDRWHDGGPADWVRIDVGPADRNSLPALQCALDEAVCWLSVAERLRPMIVITGLEILADEDVSRLLQCVIDGLPPWAQLVAVGSGNGLPASFLVRLSGELAELRSVDLWWSRAELVQQLARLTGIEASESEAEQLFRLTEGWPAGVIILGRAMRSAPAVLLSPDLTAIPEILDFVSTEVLARLGARVRRWVLRTSVLDQLEVDDCAALVPDEIPHAMLAQVYRQGLSNPQELRYHPLVRAAALRELRSADTDAERGLLRIAGEQARRRGCDTVAVTYLVAGEDWDAVLAILLRAAGQGFRDWDPDRLRATVQRLPERAWEHEAERCALVAFAAGMAGDQMFAAQVLQRTAVGLRDTAGWWPVMARLIEALHGSAGRTNGGYRSACSALVELQMLDRAISIPQILGVTDRPSLTGMAHLLAARAGVFDRDQGSVRRHLEAGWSVAGAQIPQYCMLAGLGADALTAAWGGQLAAAQRRATRAQRLADEAGLAEHPMLSLAQLARVEVLRARGRSAQALLEVDASTPALHRSEPFLATASGGRTHITAAQILRAILHIDLREANLARAELDRIEAEGDEDLPRNLCVARAIAWARLHLLSDDVLAAEQVLAAAPDTGTVAGTRIAAALQRQAPEEAQKILRNWPFEDTLDNQIRLLLNTSAIAIDLNHRPEAGEKIDQALVAAEPDGHIQIFLDAPPRARAMVSAVLKRSLDSSSWRTELADRLDRIRILAAANSVVPVTRRERAVLEHLTTPMTHAQIASELFVSDNTLKSHCRNLYRKLGVNTRAEAISAARARGLLESAPHFSPEGDHVLELNITPVPVVVEL